MNKQIKRWEIINKTQKPNLKTKDIVRILLKNRGIKTQKGKKEFFSPTPPEKLPLKSLEIKQAEVRKAVARLKAARKNGENVIVYGDYDADGICGTAILWEALFALGLKVMPHIPERFSEGYGLNVESIKKLKSENPNLGLIITVDHGIVANKKIDFAKELGIDVIITDHHEVGRTIPKAHAIIHTTKISGAAVAWIFAREIAGKLQIAKTLELAAIGTIADQLPLIGPNRSFAKYGLEALNKTTRPGLLALFNEAALKTGEIGTYEINFIIAPRINAMGRLKHAIDSLRLLCVKGTGRARELAAHLGRVNKKRQKILEEVVLHASRKAQGKPLQNIIVIAHESYHEGVIGLAASKLVEEFYRPAIVLAKKSEISKASARSIQGFNIIEAIRKLEDLYIEGGGHPMAAGFSIQTTMIQEFSRRINEVATPLLTEEVLVRKQKIDLEIDFSQVSPGRGGDGWKLLKAIESFEPTGIGNPTPTFATRGVNVLDARAVGTLGKHLKLTLEEKGVVFSAIAFGEGETLGKLTPASKVDIAFCLEADNWNGRRGLQLKIKDLRLV